MENEQNDLYRKGCIIIFASRFWGATKTLDRDQLGDLPEEIVHASRDLLIETDKLEAVRGIIGDAKRFIKSNSMRFPIPGVDFINKSRISYVDDALKSKKAWAQEAVEDLIGTLESAKARYKAKYPDLYSEGNYPTAAQLRDNFKFEWDFRIISPPGKDLEVLSPEVYERCVADFKKQMEEFQSSLISTVAKEFYDRIDRLREQCIGGDVSASTVKSVHTVLEKFGNVYEGCLDNKELQKMIDDIKMYLEGTDAAMLKSDSDFRNMVGGKMKEVTALMINSKDPRLTRLLDI